ncbi:unnamed protein product [Ceratitis capitata]|nr:unnamed protein product [Ceratitis capitata]
MVRLNVLTTSELHSSQTHQLQLTNSSQNTSGHPNVFTSVLNNSISSSSSSTSSLNSNTSSFEQHQNPLQHQFQHPFVQTQYQHPNVNHLHHQQQRATANVVMVVPQQQPTLQYAHRTTLSSQHQMPQQHTVSRHVHHQASSQSNAVVTPSQQQQPNQLLSQQSPSESSTSSLPASPPLFQHSSAPPQSAQVVQPVCALHHPHQHQQLALVAAMHQHLTPVSLGSLPHQHIHHPVQPLSTQPSQQQPQTTQQNLNDNDHSGGCRVKNAGGSNHSNVSDPGSSPDGSTESRTGITSNNGGATIVAAPSTPGQIYIQYPSEFYPTEYYLTPNSHDNLCPQHHHQTICAMPSEYGPTAVQMVSQNRPATISVPVQVPQNQVMQQYVNESSPFAHVVLSPQYQQLHSSQGHMHAPFLTANGTSHFYSPLTAGFAPGPGSGPTHFHALSSGHVQTQQSTQQQQPVVPQKQQTPSQQPLSHSPSPPNSYHKDERTQRQHTKLLRKLEKQRELNSGMSTPTHAPSPRHSILNGFHSLSVVSPNSSGVNGTKNHVSTPGILTTDATSSSSSIANSTNSIRGLSTPQNQFQNHTDIQPDLSSSHLVKNYSFHSGTTKKYDKVTTTAHLLNNATHLKKKRSETDAQEDTSEMNLNTFEGEEDCQSLLIEQLSAIRKPSVINVTSRSAKIIWEAPVITDPQINIREFRYNVLFSDRAKDGKYKSLYKGDSFECIVQDLLPGQLYVVRLQVHYEKLQGSPSDPAEFTTPPCEPDQPMPPKLVMRTKNSLHLRWNNPAANGSPIQHYLLEYDEGKSVSSTRAALQNIDNEVQQFVEATKTRGKHYTLTKLHPSTAYNFRLAAINEMGMSSYSTICSYATSGNPPTSPKPPKLQSSSSTSLRLWWERRQQDGDYILQILDRESGHGYLNAYNGPDSSHECSQLRRATAYQFRLRAENEAGCSPWSNEITFQTAPEKPGRPGKPYVKGKIHGTHFRARWDPPTDTGGAEILRYYLEITSGSKFERIYSGTDTETNCDRLQPGTTYQLRTSCEGPAGLSPYSDIAHITSEALVPAAPPPPYYDNPPGRNVAVLRLEKPDDNGGAPVLEFEVQMRRSLEEQFDIAKKVNEKSIVYHGRDTYCMVKDLQPGSSYEVQVRVFNRIGAGPWSSWFRFSTAAGPPNAPHDLKVTVKSATHLFVNWEEPSCNGAPIIEYHLESLTVDNENESILEESSETRTYHTCYQGEHKSIDLRNLAPFTIYYFRVNATNTVGVSKWSTSITARTPASVPAAPQIKDCEFTANKAVFNWTEPECNGAPITAYNIEYAENLLTTTNANTNYTITELIPETTYKLRLQAINSIGPGPYSSYTKFTTLPSPPLPPVLECTGVGHNFVKLKWGDGKNLDFTKYYVEMFVQRAKEFQLVYSGTSCMCKVNKLQECTAYTFRIYASTDRAGTGDFSDEYTFKTTPTFPSSIKAPRVAMEGAAACLVTHGVGGGSGFIPSGMIPETPTSFIAGLGNLSLGVPLTLEWQNSKNSFSDRVEYVLQYAIGKDGDYKRIYRGPETKFTIENLEPGAIYQFRVCPIRVTMDGEDLQGQYTSAFRYQVPHFAALDHIDHNILGNMTNVFGTSSTGVNGNSNGSLGCHGHSHMAHHVHSMHAHHTHNNSSHSHSHHNSRQSSSGLHHRSVSASAASSNSSANINGNSNNGSNAILIGPNAIGLIPLGTAMANELSAVGFTNCEDPLHHHHHHHHHHQFHGTNVDDVDESEISTQTTATFLAATANTLLTNNPLLAHGIASVNPVQHGAVRRCMSKLTTIYTNRKRFTDQEKAVLFMLGFIRVLLHIPGANCNGFPIVLPRRSRPQRLRVMDN